MARSERSSLACAAIAALALCGCGSETGLVPSPRCLINFEVDNCPDAVEVCGASLVGGQTCEVQNLSNCYESGAQSYRLAPSETAEVLLTATASRIGVFLASEGPGPGRLTFYDSRDLAVGTVVSGTNCVGAVKPSFQTVSLAAPAVRATVTASTSTLWLDDLILNP